MFFNIIDIHSPFPFVIIKIAMIKNKRISGSNSGYYNFKLRVWLNIKDWICHWFIIKNLFEGKGDIINKNRDDSGFYFDVVGYHSANRL